MSELDVEAGAGAPAGQARPWCSRQALVLHGALVLWFPGCLLAFWWQVHRAFGGNDLSYLYSVEWPVFALVGVYAWWKLLHTTPGPADDEAGPPPVEVRPAMATRPPEVLVQREESGPELAAYNDRLARLAREGPASWRRS